MECIFINSTLCACQMCFQKCILHACNVNNINSVIFFLYNYVKNLKKVKDNEYIGIQYFDITMQCSCYTKNVLNSTESTTINYS